MPSEPPTPSSLPPSTGAGHAHPPGAASGLTPTSPIPIRPSTPAASPRKALLWTAAVLGIVALLVLPRLSGGDDEAATGAPGGGGGGARGGPGGGRGTPTVTVALAAARPLEDGLTATGTLLAWEEVALNAEVAGRVVSLGFDEGAYVRRGQLLAVLNTDVIEAQTRALQTQLDLARVQYQRQQALFEIGGLSEAALDQARSQVRVLEAQVAQQRAESGRRRVVAPFSGRIGLSDLSVGAYVSPGQPIATLRVTSPLKLEFAVPERYAGRIRPGAVVDFSIPGIETPLSGTVYATEPAVEAATRTFTVRARVGNPEGTLQPGTFAEVRLVLDRVEAAVLVPTSALTPGADSSFVWTLRGGEAVRRSVATGVRTATEVQILSGIAAGDSVLTSGFEELRPGQAVRVARAGGFDPTTVAPDTARSQTGTYRPAQ